MDARHAVARKRDGQTVPDDHLRAFILGYARGDVPDYLAAAFLMAAYLNGLTARETAVITRAMVDSGITLPLSGVSRPKVDKHSTGGVSDGVTLVFAPLAASLGLAVAKLSGRGLGHTGGTLDKLESIPGLRTEISPEDLERQVEAVGCAVAGQSKDLVPADGALYALRDATGTVASVPLIAASVMSKKLAVTTDMILLDVKAGSGAFMKTPEEAAELAEACVALAGEWGRPIRAAVTDMSQPLGRAVGNAIEVAEAIRVLRGEEDGPLAELAVMFAGQALASLTGSGTSESLTRAGEVLRSGGAAEVFGRMVEAQGGQAAVVDDPDTILPRAPVRVEVESDGGYIAAIDAEAVGRIALDLGAGRTRKGDPIDPAVGLHFYPRLGDRVEDGQVIATVHARDHEAAGGAAVAVRSAVALAQERIEPPPLVHSRHGLGPVDG